MALPGKKGGDNQSFHPVSKAIEDARAGFVFVASFPGRKVYQQIEGKVKTHEQAKVVYSD
jgi:hypothetical protein